MNKNSRSWGWCWIFVLILVLAIVGSWLILMASGYRLNWQAKKIQKTGLIYLKSTPREVDIYLDGHLVRQQTPAKINNLLPHRYEVEVKKENYQSWKKSFNVSSGQVEVADNIVLFLQKPPESQLSTEEEKQFTDSLPKSDKPSGLLLKDGEIWWQDDLITRFSTPVKMAQFYPDKKHLALQINKEIHLIDLDGSNDLKLLDLDSDEPAKIQFASGGEYLIYQDGSQLRKVKIR